MSIQNIQFVNYYEILDIDKDSNFEQIKAAFRSQIKKMHPDKNTDKNEIEYGDLDQENCKRILEAWNILKDEKKRKFQNQYNQNGQQQNQENLYNQEEDSDQEIEYECEQCGEQNIININFKECQKNQYYECVGCNLKYQIEV
ncbi:DnaJ domain [Pseudocohnilembus persalinus]|uniref:DnaJ domain n=1 Tax=Pseudocohnilembus persalinus TaxID=266149 RepID=A0A0V0R2Z8_PSEPJ|nr:DnaJ domain [Pseudocohnilembus persalinus]|eukprot:KRX08884.1 DnaJ domain [Pseudocohnilembus persalinus]